MMSKKEKQYYTRPYAELLKLSDTHNILDSLSIHSDWEDFVDGDDQDQY